MIASDDLLPQADGGAGAGAGAGLGACFTASAADGFAAVEGAEAAGALSPPLLFAAPLFAAAAGLEALSLGFHAAAVALRVAWERKIEVDWQEMRRDRRASIQMQLQSASVIWTAADATTHRRGHELLCISMKLHGGLLLLVSASGFLLIRGHLKSSMNRINNAPRFNANDDVDVCKDGNRSKFCKGENRGY